MSVEESSTAGSSTLTGQLLVFQGKFVVVSNLLSGDNPGSGKDGRVKSERRNMYMKRINDIRT